MGDVDLGGRVQAELDRFLASKTAELTMIDPRLEVAVEAICDFVRGGKRLRPAFCYWGWRGAGRSDCREIVTAASAFELLHAAALIHDDYMDSSDTRRGRPAVHRQFAARHAEHGWRGCADDFGAAAAIILGDLCLSWCDELFESCGLPELGQAKPTFQLMRAEVMAGQYLDVLAQVNGRADVGRALRVIEYKAAKYTVERPLQVGGQLGDAPARLITAYSAFGLPTGVAFQLRDDVLGVFGDPAKTGKPAGDDLREGKQTVLVAVAYERAGAADRSLLDRAVGDPSLDEAGVAELRELLVRTGALAEVEDRIRRLTEQAVAALEAAPIAEVARAALRELAVVASSRTS